MVNYMNDVRCIFICINSFECLKKQSDNGIRTHNHLVRKRTLSHLAKLTYEFQMNPHSITCLNVKELLA